MKWGLTIADPARRATRAMPGADGEQRDAAFEEMREGPYGGDIKFLEGPDRTLRRGIGAGRILFEVHAARHLVVIFGVERRSSITY